ncbi:MAG: ABC transporter ATP-binding protein [Thiogranum sp.]
MKDVSFEVRKGETVGIIGRNGSGKSTLLQLVCGTLAPTSGDVAVRGRVAALLELGSGFNPEFTGRENVYMYGAILGLGTAQMDERFDKIAGFADIGGFIEQPVKTYSSGMVIRLAFAVIAHIDADILVIDEALAVGDARFVQKCMRFLRAFMKKGSVLFVSHDIGAVTSLCDRAIWIHNGDKKLSGSPKQVSEAYLASLFDGDEDIEKRAVPDDEASLAAGDEDYRDMRLEYINETNLRNDIELVEFNPAGESFGKKGAVVSLVSLEDEQGRKLSWVVGGEMVALVINCTAIAELNNPIVGFYLKDRLGQTVFGDNTYITHMNKVFSISAGRKFSAKFRFRMPILPNGDYSVAVAIAEGTQEDHMHHHWVHDALIIKVHSSSVCHGLIGVPMKDIEISVVE